MTKDKEAMEKAAAMYVSGPDCELSETFSAHCDTFEAGWQSCLNGPAVMGLVEALKNCVDAWGDYAPSPQTKAYRVLQEAKQTLAEFEATKE